MVVHTSAACHHDHMVSVRMDQLRHAPHTKAVQAASFFENLGCCFLLLFHFWSDDKHALIRRRRTKPTDDTMRQNAEGEENEFKGCLEVSEMRKKEMDGTLKPEPLLVENPGRFVLFPIQDNEVSRRGKTFLKMFGYCMMQTLNDGNSLFLYVRVCSELTGSKPIAAGRRLLSL